MEGRKRSLRITAGVLILIAVAAYVIFGIADAIRTVGTNFRSIVSTFFRQNTEWMLLCGAAMLLVAIFVFARKFVVAGAAMCAASAYWLYMIVRSLLFGGSVFTILNMAFGTLLLAASVLAAVGFFRRRKSSRALFVISGALTLLAVAGAMTFLLGFAADILGLPRDKFLEIISLAVIGYIPEYLPTIIAWFLLAGYFGAQEEPARAVQRGYAPQQNPGRAGWSYPEPRR